MSENRSIFTLKQVVSSIRKTLEERYQQLYWIRAEMHKLNRYPSGHCFPELVQKEEDKIVAQMTASIWKQNFERINRQFVEIVKEPLKEGTTLLMQVRITFHETFGLSLQILDIDPNYALGELQRERQETLLKLQKAGLLNLNQQLPFPLLPKRVAIISADTSKGLSDFRKVIEQYAQQYSLFTVLFPAYLQGDVAVPSILEQLARIEKVKAHFDVVVIVRGGGGEVGLACYNHYELCARIAAFPLPILTGIGHSTNLTVAEMVAFRNAITPTELADFLIHSFVDFEQEVNQFQLLITQAFQTKLAASKIALSNTSKLFKQITVNQLLSIKNDLHATSNQVKSSAQLSLVKSKETIYNSQFSIKRSVKEYVLHQNTRIHQSQMNLVKGGKTRLKSEHLQVDNTQLSLQKNWKNTIQIQANKIEQFEIKVRLIDPIHVLKRGYAMVLQEGKIISKANPAKKGATIQITTHDQSFDATVD